MNPKSLWVKPQIDQFRLRKFMRRTWIYALAVSVAIVTGLQSPANASTLIVTNGNDSGSGSLRSALAGSSDGDIITFAAGLTTVTLTSGKLEVTKGVTISGTASSVITVTRSATAGTNFSIFSITPPQNTTVTLDYLDIANGNDGGVGISSTGGSVVNIKHSTIRDNERTWAGGIYAVNGAGGPGSLLVDSTTITGNTSNGGISCGYCNGAGGIIEIPTVFVNSTIAYNRSGDNGGGIKVDSNVRFYNSTIAYNSANGLGAGIWETRFSNYPELTMVNTLIAKNTIGSASGAAQCNTTGGSDSYVVAENKNNLIEDGSCNYIRTTLNSSTSPATNFLSGDPLLGTFGLDNGINKIFPLITGSQAIGAGDSAVCSGVYVAGVDQQGTTRGIPCSIGSIELLGAAPSAQSGTTSPGPAIPSSSKKLKLKFESGKSELTPAMRKSLKKLASSLVSTQTLSISVSTGLQPGISESEARNLSKQRAKTITSYLKSLGLVKTQFKVKISTVKFGITPITKIRSLPLA